MVRAGVVLPGDESLVVSDTELCGTIRIRQLMQNFFEKLRFLHDCIVKSVHVVSHCSLIRAPWASSCG